MDILKHGREVLRSLRNKKYEVTDAGDLLLPEQKLLVGGRFYNDVNGLDPQWSDNIIVKEGLNYFLDVALHGASQLTTWYIALFSGNVTPVNTWTAANFTSLSTEFTNYTESARQEWVETGSASETISNLAAKAAFTMNTGGGSIYGGALISASAKSATTGSLAAAARFASVRTLSVTDVLNVGYSLSASST